MLVDPLFQSPSILWLGSRTTKLDKALLALNGYIAISGRSSLFVHDKY